MKADAADSAPDEVVDTDVIVVGAGPVGMTLALALAGSALRVLLVDRRPRGAWAADPRALALSHGCRQLLARLEAWNATAGTPIGDIHVSQRGGFGRTCMTAADYGVPALGYVMRYRDLAAALDARLDTADWCTSAQVDSVAAGEHGVSVHLDCAGARPRRLRVNARLLVHADGTPGDTPEVRCLAYDQHALIAEVRAATPHRQRAWERFTADGPLALLPLDGGTLYAVVCTLPPARAAELLALDEAAFLAALREQFAGDLEFVASGARASYPLALRLRRELVDRRQVWIGNAAQTLHPVSGQGFNLGLRDAWELAAALLDDADRGSAADPGDAALLRRYARGRALDRQGSAAFTDGIVRLFSNDLPPLRAVRGLGLLALDLFPPLRHFVARRMIWGARAWF